MSHQKYNNIKRPNENENGNLKIIFAPPPLEGKTILDTKQATPGALKRARQHSAETRKQSQRESFGETFVDEDQFEGCALSFSRRFLSCVCSSSSSNENLLLLEPENLAACSGQLIRQHKKISSWTLLRSKFIYSE
jgi:hypothetical protein